MQSNLAIQFLPSIRDDKKIEVALENDVAVLKLSTWTESLGWSCQKTMRLEADMLDDLHRVISAARYRLNQKKTTNENDECAKVLSFPTVSV